MTLDPDIHHRRSIRLRGYDYSQAGMYFVTICTQGRLRLFGEVVDGVMKLNDAGLMIERWYFNLKNKFSNIECGEFVCMPNHIHAIVVNVGADLRVRPGQTHGSAPTGVGTSLSRVVQWFKTMSTNEYIRGVEQNGWQPFPAKLWQRNYYEHIIRDEDSYLKIAEYIQTNPQRWQMDTYHV